MKVQLQRVSAWLLPLLLCVACSSPAPIIHPRQIPAPSESAAEPEPREEPRAQAGNHSPYRVHGRTYYVLPSSEGYNETGTASWYGPNFHGKPTSSMEIFDMHQFTAAHRSLPLPTYARVTHLGNGRSVVVRINDRGPFIQGRIIDLSFAAAQKLDMVNEGTALVEVRALEPEGEDAEPRPVITTGDHIYLQLGAFGSRANAEGLMQRLRNHGIGAVDIYPVASENITIFRVRIGPLRDVEQADELVARITLLGLERPRVIFE